MGAKKVLIAVLFDKKFSTIHINQENINTLYPVNGWVEQDANEIWEKTLLVTKNIISYLYLYIYRNPVNYVP